MPGIPEDLRPSDRHDDTIGRKDLASLETANIASTSSNHSLDIKINMSRRQPATSYAHLAALYQAGLRSQLIHPEAWQIDPRL